MMKWKCWIAGITAALILAAAPITDAAAQGWQKNSTGWWWEYVDGSYPASAWQQVDGIWYWFDADGYMATGWVQVGGTWYYMDSSGAMQIGWVQVGGTWYYMDSSGAMQIGWVQVGGTWYYMDSSGAMQTGWVQVGGTWYYMDSSGAMQTGWVQVGSTWYYMDSSGAMLAGCWLRVNGGEWYYLLKDGSMATGWVQEAGIWYYMEADGRWNSSMTRPVDTDTQTSKPQTPTPPPATPHEHTWYAVYDSVYHAEEGHWEHVMVAPAWKQPISEIHAACYCGYDYTAAGEEVYSLSEKHKQFAQQNNPNNEHGGWHDISVIVGYEDIPAIYEDQWVVDSYAWWEPVLTGYQCLCGATKDVD